MPQRTSTLDPGVAAPHEAPGIASLSTNLVRLRKERQLTQAQLAELVQVQQRMISRWETSAAAPHLEHLVRLAEVLEVSLDRLVRGNGETGGARFDIRNRRLKHLCQRVDGLNQADQEVVCHVMDSLIRKEQGRAVTPGTLPRSS